VDSTIIRLIHSTNTDPVFNVALEEALHLSAEDGGGPFVRSWRCEEAVVLGYSRKVNDDVFPDACETDGIPVIRRHSGGGTVYIHPEVLNFTIIVPYMNPVLQPRSHIRESVYFFLKPLVDTLKRRGYPADINGNGDIFLNGRKVGGNAQARKKRTILHHGTLMIEDRVGRMSKYLRVPPERKDIPHTEFVTSFKRENLPFNEDAIITEALQNWRDELGLKEIIHCETYQADLIAAQRLVEVKYSKKEHNLKR
jgi:lipoate-protein ligase A